MRPVGSVKHWLLTANTSSLTSTNGAVLVVVPVAPAIPIVKLYPVANPQCGCEADITAETTMLAERRGEWNGLLGTASEVVWTIRRAKKVFHYRERDQAHFWHWSDQEVIKI